MAPYNCGFIIIITSAARTTSANSSEIYKRRFLWPLAVTRALSMGVTEQ